MEKLWSEGNKKEFEEFKSTLGNAKISNCFKDFLTDIHVTD